MAYNSVSQPVTTATTGAALDVLSDANALTYAGLGLGAVTLGGAAFVAAAVAPAHVVGGTLATATCFAGAEVKRRTGSYLPFLDNDEDKKDKQLSSEPAVTVQAAA